MAKLGIRGYLAVVLACSSACGEVIQQECDSQHSIARNYMCADQATLYCNTMRGTEQFETCLAVYESLCYPSGDDVCISAHESCMEALGPISMGQGSGTGGAGFVPQACRESWQ
jgi:hypothetical protein